MFNAVQELLLLSEAMPMAANSPEIAATNNVALVVSIAGLFPDPSPFGDCVPVLATRTIAIQENASCSDSMTVEPVLAK